MTPTIRISDETFERLKKLAEPFVDTPGHVVERLLDLHDARHESITSQHTSTVDDAQPISRTGNVGLLRLPGRENLFLAPAATENVSVTLDGTVSLHEASTFLSPRQTEELRKELGNRDRFHCWAMTRNSRAKFSAMRPGDHVLLSERGTGVFGFYGTILTTLESSAFGLGTWPHRAELPWELVYVFDTLRHINIPKRVAVEALGYDPKDRVLGIRRVNRKQLSAALNGFDSIEDFIKSLE